MRSEALATAALAGAFVLTAGCSSDPESFIVLRLQSATPITGIVSIRVGVSKMMVPIASLTYPARGMSIDQTQRTLSVGFPGNETGDIDFDVDALDDRNPACSIGHGTVKQAIKKGNIAYATVTLAAGLICPSPDAGAPDAPEGGTLPGCDPVNPQSTATGVTTCTGAQTCQVCGQATNPTPRNECVTGGSGAPGTVCKTNADCQPGTQCFNYMNLGCMVSLCLRFCNDGAECAAFGAGGGGPGSVCEGPVKCPTGLLTAYHTCTFNCDPRAMAAASRGGCPSGLACVMPAAMDQVDCSCPEATRTKGEGAACASAAECAPGLICNQMSGTRTCRPICRCNANGAGACTNTVPDCPTANTTCRAVTNNTIYGVCLP